MRLPKCIIIAGIPMKAHAGHTGEGANPKVADIGNAVII
jgi:hypothetical protein